MLLWGELSSTMNLINRTCALATVNDFQIKAIFLRAKNKTSKQARTLLSLINFIVTTKKETILYTVSKSFVIFNIIEFQLTS